MPFCCVRYKFEGFYQKITKMKINQKPPYNSFKSKRAMIQFKKTTLEQFRSSRESSANSSKNSKKFDFSQILKNRQIAKERCTTDVSFRLRKPTPEMDINKVKQWITEVESTLAQIKNWVKNSEKNEELRFLKF